jgi:transcriptional regulator with XRE-family HTH domain
MWHKPSRHKIVGSHLERLRKHRGVTQSDLAKRLKKPQSFISNYESGQRRIDLLEFAAIVSELNEDPRIVSAEIFDALVKPARSARSR